MDANIMNQNDEANNICECTLGNPCMLMCSCANEILSGGCLKCDRYGKPREESSGEQLKQ